MTDGHRVNVGPERPASRAPWSSVSEAAMGVQERKAREFNRREQEILAAALQLFRRDEWQTVTVEQIAQQAEIGKGTVYKHFASKDEIYARLALRFHRGILDATRRVD